MVSTADDDRDASRPRPGDLLGHPRGLMYLIGVEGFWAFGYFGLQGLLTLYMTQHLLLPGHVEKVWGFDVYRRLFLDGAALSPVEIASQTFGLLTSLAYALPLLGALLADRWLGQRRTMIAGLVVLTAAMALVVTEAGFLAGLALIVLGNGLMKCNLMVAIGRLYAPDDARRTSAFAMYLIAATVGSMSAPLIAGTLAEKVSFPAGLTALTVGMSLALVSYLMGRPHYAHDRPPAAVTDAAVTRRPGVSTRDLTIGLVLIAALMPEVLFFGAYQQAFNMFPIWAADHVDRTILGFEMPVTWFSTLDGVLTIAGALVAVRLWDSQVRRGRPMADLAKMAVGGVLGVIGFGILAAAAWLVPAGKAPLIAAVGFFAFVDPAISWVDTVSMALVSRAAPASINSTMMGVYALASALAYYITGQLGRLYEHGSAAAFWSLHVGMNVTLLAFLALAGPFIARALATPGGAKGPVVVTAGGAA